MCCSIHHHNQNQTMNAYQAMEIAEKNRHRGRRGWCLCPGDDGATCCGAATGDDGLCDRCRTHCRADHAANVAVAPAESVPR